MKPTLAAAVVLVWVAAPVFAHRLDEYLQDATVSLEQGRVSVQMRLTPGVGVLHTILATIDTDADGVISETEQRAYVQRVLRDLSLSVDGRPLTPRLRSATFPTVDDMKEGVGEILLDFDAPVPPGGSERRLVFENHHDRGVAAYLVNCLVPKDPTIRVESQSRSYDQSFYRLDYVQPRDRSGALAPASWSTLRLWVAANALVLFVWLASVVRRRRRPTHDHASSRPSV
jgi:hypothetical protein